MCFWMRDGVKTYDVNLTVLQPLCLPILTVFLPIFTSQLRKELDVVGLITPFIGTD